MPQKKEEEEEYKVEMNGREIIEEIEKMIFAQTIENIEKSDILKKYK